ncbi:PREDICTED: ATP-binding cassette sub-family A member 5-like, partial [Priapulus caudatus]|uniref:ATP-binding cassette sub-family A member 5-like n=1 Tax=Priapulus caudatus TaxID=37621 RepID=A0ABM1EU83_PRICU
MAFLVRSQEIITPLFFIAILVAVRLTQKVDELPVIPSYPSASLYNTTDFWPLTSIYGATPNTTAVNAFMVAAMDTLARVQNSSPPYFELFATEAELENAYKANHSMMSVGIVFSSDGPLLDTTYTIRAPGQYIDLNNDFTNPGVCRSDQSTKPIPECPANWYLYSGFSLLQGVLDTTLLQLKTGRAAATSDVVVLMMPKPSHTPDVSYMQSLSSIYLVIAFAPFVSFLLVLLVTEKEMKIKETMKMMGMRDAAFWLSWTIVYMVIITVICFIMELIAKYARLFPGSSFILMFIALLLYGMSIITFSFMLTPFLHKGKTAGAFGSFATIIFSMLYFVVKFVPGVSVTVRWLLCLLSPVALTLAIDQAVLLETTSGGVNLDNVNEGIFPFSNCLIMMAVDTLIYLLLAAYFENIIPGEYGQRLHPLFCLKRSYWFPSVRPGETSSLLRDVPAVDYTDAANFDRDIEPISDELKDKAAIRIVNVSKSFKAQNKEVTRAVDGLSLDLYEGQITALLGHNGAGKTTLINLLTGQMCPSTGCASIYGLNIAKPSDMDVIRGMTGVCPQQDILFDVLTPREHLEVFASLKGVVPARLNAEVVFLDEPTASMDPYSRRQVWSLLRRLRPGRIILLTTHMMDEADILADRKAIMSSGRLRCVGSSFFLKSRFGIGYHLTIVTSQPSCERDRSRIVATLRQHVPLAQQARAHGMELSYILPLDDISSFAALFVQLETDKEELGVASYGIAMTTLEEVFLRLGEEGGDDILEENVNPAQCLIERQGSVLSSNTRLERSLSRGGHTNPTEFNIQEEGAGTTAGGAVIDVSRDVMSCSYVQREGTELHATWWQQFKVLHKVRWMNTLRSIKAVLLRIFIPAVLVAVSLALAASSTLSTQEPTKYTFRSATYNAWDVLYTNSSPSSVDALLSGLTSQGLDVAQMGNYDDLLNVGVHYQAMDVHQFDTGGENMTWTAIYNDSGLHALPTLMNAVATARLRSLGADAAAAIAASVQPWRSLTGETFTFDYMSFFSVMILGVVLTMVPVGFVSEVVQDRELRCSSQLRISGTSFAVYWASFFAMHVMQCLIPVILCIIVVLAFQVSVFSSGGAIMSLLLLFTICMLACILFAYVISFLFTKSETAEIVVVSAAPL